MNACFDRSAAVSLTAHEYLHANLPDTFLAAWHRLTAQSGSGAFFAAPMFVRSFAAVFGDRVTISILALHGHDGALCGLLPLMRTNVRRSPSFSARYGYQMADFAFLNVAPARISLPAAQISTPLGLEATCLRSEILAVPDLRQAVLAAIPSALARLRGWNVGVLVVDAADAGILSAGPLASHIRPLGRDMKFLSKVCSADDLVALQSQKFRQNVRRSVKFSSDAGAVFETIRGIGAVREAMPELKDLATRSWKAPDAGGRADTEEVFIPYTDRQRAFFERLMQTGEGEPVIVAARIDGQMVSAMLMLVHYGRLLTFLIYSDLAHARLGVGRLVLHAGIDFAHAEGLSEIDYNSNANWTIPYADKVSSRDNLLLAAPGIGGRWRHALAARFSKN